MLSNEIFQRYELKYLIPFEKYQEIAKQLTANGKLRYDKFGDGFGCYNIVSLYFDSDDKKIYYETRNKLRFRQKLRLRIYDDATINSPSFLEIKQKFNKVVNKRRTKIKLADAYEYLKYGNQQGDLRDYEPSNPQIMNEVESFRSLYELKPRVVVSYDRQAFHGVEDSDLRVTFDYNLMARDNNLHIEDGPGSTYFVNPNLVVMEVKVSQSVPFWLSRMLSEFECPRRSVSKFCTSIDLMEEMQQSREQSVNENLKSLIV
ncbi:polyphosphate polymerase domain-containing protein [Alteribacillus bidgolensis]|uniref:VTC domain-containing protein n=1 Tax=Alteribacillus bidgolensis TaxID=930129 RepID=A0A1G8DY35_9BACI|nr:polyphosphate polymerase domain-containing protein [Alteribacillus bidgolensis]SDH62498.1 VTC domain-containing protein [Alteribacillus bidgolensis]